jgi:hypothetical protein
MTSKHDASHDEVFTKLVEPLRDFYTRMEALGYPKEEIIKEFESISSPNVTRQ